MNDHDDHARTEKRRAQDSSVTVIIPTLATRSRHLSLIRAITSALLSSNARISVLVVVNGDRWDKETLDEIGGMHGVRLAQLNAASLPDAVAFGRREVKTEFFAFLDDDDELVPDGLDKRIDLMFEDPACDIVVTNGYRRINDEETLALSNLDNVEDDPLRELFVENWLPSCGALFRSETVGSKYFSDYQEYAEWTWRAYRFAMDRKRIRALNSATYIVNDTQNSLSKTAGYRESYLTLFKRMLELDPPLYVRSLIKRRLASALHDASSECLARGDIWTAIQYHLRSIAFISGLKYMAYSRHLLFAVFRR